MRKLSIIVMTALLTACGGGGGGSSGTAPAPLPAAAVPYVSCADMYNGTVSPHCPAQTARAWYDWALPSAQAGTITDAGTISLTGTCPVMGASGCILGAPAVRVDIANPTGVAKLVWLEIRYDTDCGPGTSSDGGHWLNGAAQAYWDYTVTPPQWITPQWITGQWVFHPKQQLQVAANATYSDIETAMCGSMPLGPHQVVATVWDTDGVTILDTYVVQFNLVQ